MKLYHPREINRICVSEKSSEDRIDRRDVLKKTAAVGGISAVGLSQSSVAQNWASNATSADEPADGPPSFAAIQDGVITGTGGRVLGYEDSEVKIQEPEIVTGGRARREARGAMSNREVKEIRDWFQQRGLRPNVDQSLAIDLTYSDEIENSAYDEEAINDADPMVVTIPYVPTGNVEGEGGLLKLFMVDDGPRRVAGGAIGFHVVKNDDARDVSVIGQSDGDVAVIHEESLPAGFTESGYAECMACELAVGGLCEGTYGTVGYAGCMFVCTGSGPAWIACTPVCVALVGVSTGVMCYIGADQFCKQRGFC